MIFLIIAMLAIFASASQSEQNSRLRKLNGALTKVWKELAVGGALPACWIRLPTGCEKGLGETNDPTKWFKDPHNGDTTSCSSTRLAAFENWCQKQDGENFWGTEEQLPGQDEPAASEVSEPATAGTCVYPVMYTDSACYPEKSLIAGSVSSPAACYAAAKSDTACYKRSDAKGHFFYNNNNDNNCRCPTDRCSSKKSQTGSYIFKAVCGDDIDNFEYTDYGVGICMRTESYSYRGTSARYDQLREVTQAQCKTSCDYRANCQGYSFNPNEGEGYCYLWTDHIKLQGNGREEEGKKCFIKKFWVATKGQGKPSYIKMNGVIVGVHNYGGESEMQTLTFKALSTHIVPGFALIGGFAILFTLYDGCKKYSSAYENVADLQEI